MKKQNKEIINHYQEYIAEIEEIIDKVDNDKVLSRHQRTRFINFLDKVVFHCRGMIHLLDGSYHKK